MHFYRDQITEWWDPAPFCAFYSGAMEAGQPMEKWNITRAAETEANWRLCVVPVPLASNRGTNLYFSFYFCFCYKTVRCTLLQSTQSWSVALWYATPYPVLCCTHFFYLVLQKIKFHSFCTEITLAICILIIIIGWSPRSRFWLSQSHVSLLDFRGTAKWVPVIQVLTSPQYHSTSGKTIATSRTVPYNEIIPLIETALL